MSEEFSIKYAILVVITVIGAGIYKILAWLMPKTAELFFDGVKARIIKIVKESQEDLVEKLNELNSKLENYKKEKHDLENVNAAQAAIIDKQAEALKISKQEAENLIEKLEEAQEIIDKHDSKN